MREQMVTRKSENALNVDTQKLRVLSFEWAKQQFPKIGGAPAISVSVSCTLVVT